MRNNDRKETFVSRYTWDDHLQWLWGFGITKEIKKVNVDWLRLLLSVLEAIEEKHIFRILKKKNVQIIITNLNIRDTFETVDLLKCVATFLKFAVSIGEFDKEKKVRNCLGIHIKITWSLWIHRHQVGFFFLYFFFFLVFRV